MSLDHECASGLRRPDDRLPEVGCTNVSTLLDCMQVMTTATRMVMKAVMPRMCLWFLLVPYTQGAEVPDPTTLLQGVQAQREQVPASRLSLKTVFHSTLNHNEFADTVEFDGELRYFVRSSTIPTRPENLRTVFNGTEVLLYDNNFVSIYNISANAPGALYDPRTLGITGALTWDKTIQQCFAQGFSVKLETVAREEIESTPTWHVRMTYQTETVLDWWIDVQHNFRVLRYAEKWQSGSRSVKSWYDNPEYRWLPSRVLKEDFGSNGGIVRRTEITVLEAEANIQIPKQTWTLEGLELPPNTRIVDTRSNLVVGYWVGNRIISEAEWNRHPDKGLRPMPVSPKRIALIAVLLSVLVIPLLVMRRSKK